MSRVTGVGRDNGLELSAGEADGLPEVAIAVRTAGVFEPEVMDDPVASGVDLPCGVDGRQARVDHDLVDMGSALRFEKDAQAPPCPVDRPKATRSGGGGDEWDVDLIRPSDRVAGERVG